MATHDARSTTFVDFDVDPGVIAHEHTPSLYAGERFVRCTTCGVTVDYTVTAEEPLRIALEELSSYACGRFGLPDVSVGNHVPTVTPEHPTYGRKVICESCGRSAPLQGDKKHVLRALAAIPCIEQLSHVELVTMLVAPAPFSPLLADLGISNWYGRLGTRHGEGVERVFRHDRYQQTMYVKQTADGAYTAAVTPSADPSAEPIAELQFPTADPSNPVTRKTAVTLVTFLAATDSLTAGQFDELIASYEETYESHRNAWLDEAYERARETFVETIDGTPESFAETFTDGPSDSSEVLRRMVGSNGFDDIEPSVFARETLGHGHEFPTLITYVADDYSWSPPVPKC